MDRPISILHLEDSALDAQFVQAVLKAAKIACQVKRVQTRDEFVQALQEPGFEVILADYSLPGYDGLSALRLARQQCPDIPFIFVTGQMGEDAAIASLTEGAVDYVLKHKISRLVPAVKRALQEVEERRERRWAVEEVHMHRDHLEELIRQRTFELETKNLLLEGEIAERKRADQILRKSDERLNLVFAGTGFGWWDWDCVTGEVFTHSNKWKMLGYSVEDVTPLIEWWINLIHPQDRAETFAALQAHLRGEVDFYEAEYRLKTKSGGWIWINDRGKVVARDENQIPLRISGTTQDITGRKMAQDELLGEKILSESTINSLPGSFYMVDERFRFVRWNHNMETESGYSAAELAQISPFTLIAHADRKRVARSINLLMNEGSYHVETEVVTKAGQHVPYYLSGNLMKFGGKKYVIGTGVDITQSKRLEEELRQAKEAAEAANRAKSTFLANMSHEIRTPMNAILGFSQLMLRDSALTPLQQQRLDSINRSGDHLMALINDVLELSKIEAGRVVLKSELVQLNSLVDDLEAMFRLQSEARQLDFWVEKDPDLPPYAISDANKLRQIFINLLSNALKFTRSGGVAWRIWRETGPEGRARLKSEVSDSGPGMTPDELARLFQPFAQTALGEQVGLGTGLGLAISREFAQRMGGDLWATSQPGKGSTFHFEVPLGEAEPDQLPALRRPRRVIGLQPGQEPYRLLVVDDHADSRIFLADLLASVGFEVRQSGQPDEAIAIFKKWRPHLSLIEINLPVSEAHKRWMRRIADAARIAVTTAAFETERARIMAMGFIGYVRKPFKEHEIFDAIQNCLGVRYCYEVEAPPEAVHEGSEAAALSAEEIARLPVEWIGKLEQATISANLKQLVSLIDQYSHTSPRAGQRMRELAEGYQYEKLLDLLRQRRHDS